MGKGNDVVGMRLGPDVMAAIESYQRNLMWKPGQVVTALIHAEERMQKALERFQPVVLDDGTPAILYTDPTGELDMLWGQDLEEPCKWLLDELKKPISARFTEPFFMYGDPR